MWCKYLKKNQFSLCGPFFHDFWYHENIVSCTKNSCHERKIPVCGYIIFILANGIHVFSFASKRSDAIFRWFFVRNEKFSFSKILGGPGLACALCVISVTGGGSTPEIVVFVPQWQFFFRSGNEFFVPIWSIPLLWEGKIRDGGNDFFRSGTEFFVPFWCIRLLWEGKFRNDGK